MKKRTLASILSLLLLFSIVSTASAASVNGFTDVSDTAWYADAVEYVTDNKLFQGKTETTFGPGDPMTRGMFVTVLGRYAEVDTERWIEGEIIRTDVNVRASASTEAALVTTVTRGDTVYVLGYANSWYQVRTTSGKTGYIRSDLMQWKSNFTDLGLLQYYTPYVHWAYSKGIVSGMGDRQFAPENSITREQICVILHQYTEEFDITLPQPHDKEQFTDDSQFSSWAKTAIYAMQTAGIVSGRDTGAFDPKAKASRAEVAIIFQRFAEALDIDDTTPPPSTGDFTYALFGNVVKESRPVSSSWFDDACFIGHSILESLGPTFGNYFPEADFFVRGGLSCKALLEYSQFSYGTNQTGTISQALGAKSYGKVYIMLGINEIGGTTREFIGYMTNLIDIVKATQPNADIYLLSVTPVTRDRVDPVYAPDNIVAFNDALQQLSLDEDCYYLDLFGQFIDDEGYADETYMYDSVHFNHDGNRAIQSYLMTHTAA